MKIAVAMSGGVDSSTAALLLKNDGHEIIGITAELSAGLLRQHYGSGFDSTSVESARQAADAIGVPLHAVDFEQDFISLVVDPFCRSYLSGRTPNPCVRCNPLIKFGSMLRYAKSLGCEKIATGHYARIRRTEAGRYYLSRGREKAKDQTYFLFMLSQESMSDILFPLGEFTKDEVRTLAAENRLTAADRPESQEICFIPDNRYPDFIERVTGAAEGPGEIVDLAGTVIGRHRGIHTYTIGQRRGLGIASSRPLYVVDIDAKRNRIIAGFREDLETRALFATEIHYMKDMELHGRAAMVKTRSTQQPVPARLSAENKGMLVVFSSPQIGISPGQAAVFYNEAGDVLGGGIIDRGIKNGNGLSGTGKDQIA